MPESGLLHDRAMPGLPGRDGGAYGTRSLADPGRLALAAGFVDPHQGRPARHLDRDGESAHDAGAQWP